MEIKTIFLLFLLVTGILVVGYLIAFFDIDTPSILGSRNDAIDVVKDRVEHQINGGEYSNITAERIHLDSYNSWRVTGSVKNGFRPSTNTMASWNFTSDVYYVNDAYKIQNFRLTIN